MKGLGNRLRSLRESTMMSQAKFAKEIGSSQSAINRFENDQSEPNCTLMLRMILHFTQMSRSRYCLLRSKARLWSCAGNYERGGNYHHGASLRFGVGCYNRLGLGSRTHS